jgi:hypothetical protein
MIYLWFATFQDYVKLIFTFIFPEWPAIGLIVVAIMALLFLRHLFKGRLGAGLKTSMLAGLVLIVGLFILHHLHKLLSLTGMFY